MTHEFFLTNTPERPDFRLIITFLWGDEHNCNTGGNADSPASRTWTEFMCENREPPHERVDIELILPDPLLLRVRSEDQATTARVTYFMQAETGCEVLRFGAPVSETNLRMWSGEEFSLEQAMECANKSIWRRATPENPFPNL